MAETMTIKGFTVVPVQGSEEGQTHYLYLKKEQTRQQESTLFVGNTPPWSTEKDFEFIFSKCCGKVEKVVLQHSPSGGKEEEPREDREAVPFPKINHRVGYITFKNEESLSKALQLPYSRPLMLKSEKSDTVFGLARYREAYLKKTSLNIDEMKKMIAKRVADYDRKEKEKEEKANEEDDEGWTVVTRTGKNKGAPRTEMEDNRVKTKDSRKRKRKELVNFYSFQRREEKKQKIEELRRKFQEDKSSIEKMKAERKFRPF